MLSAETDQSLHAIFTGIDTMPVKIEYSICGVGVHYRTLLRGIVGMV